MMFRSLQLRKLFLPCLVLALAAFLCPRTAGAADAAIQPDDVLSIVVNGEPSLSKDYTVNSKGDIEMETIGRSHVAGLTLDAAKDQLTRQLHTKIKYFELRVSFAGDSTTRVTVIGEVTKAGQVKLGTNGKLLDALAEAGPFTANADTRRITVMRKATGKAEVYDFDAVAKDRTLNVALESGDTISIPSKGANTVQIDGEVRLGGMKSLDSASTLFAAIQAAGPTETADWSRVMLRRKGNPTPEEIDLTPIRAGTQPDVPIQAGDQVTVLSRVLGMAKILGEVKTPGEKPITGKTSLLSFIGTAGGGFADKADKMKVEIRRKGQEPIKVDMEEVMTGARDSDDPELEVHPGDTVFVPNISKRSFQIVGGVKKGGEYPVRPGMKLMDALMIAEGPDVSASKKQWVISPSDPNDERIKQTGGTTNKARPASGKGKGEVDLTGLIVIDSKKLFKGDAAQNIAIKPGDSILVPQDQPTPGRPKMSLLDLIPFVSIFRGL